MSRMKMGLVITCRKRGMEKHGCEHFKWLNDKMDERAITMAIAGQNRGKLQIWRSDKRSSNLYTKIEIFGDRLNYTMLTNLVITFSIEL